MDTRPRPRLMAALSVALAVAACGGGATPTAPSGVGTSPAGGSAAGSSAGSSAAGGANGFEGQLTTSGLYSATWKVIEGAAVDPFNAVDNPTVTSDKGTFGNIKVNTDGTVSFGSGATELSQNGAYAGSGAKVTLDSGGQFVCSFTIDADLKGSTDQAILHMSGNLTVHWHPEGIGDLSCP